MLKIEKTFEEGKLTVSLTGKLNTVTAPDLDAEVSNLEGVTELVFDCTNLEQITSAGLRVLLVAQTAMEEQGKMVVAHINTSIRDVFAITGFVNFLTIE